MRTIDTLEQMCFEDSFGKMSIPVMTDYGFINCKTDDDYSYLLGVYQGLIKCIGIHKDELHEACINGKLEEFIIKKYKDRMSAYFKWFLDNKHIVRNHYQHI